MLEKLARDAHTPKKSYFKNEQKYRQERKLFLAGLVSEVMAVGSDGIIMFTKTKLMSMISESIITNYTHVNRVVNVAQGLA